MIVLLYMLVLAVGFVYSNQEGLSVILIILITLAAILTGKILTLSAAAKHSSFDDRDKDWKRKELDSIRAAVKAAAMGYPYSQWDVARILRRALLDKFSGLTPYPQSWVGTKDGRERILELLGSNRDLINVFEPNEAASRRRFVLKPSKNRIKYLAELDRALKLVEPTR